MIYLAVCVLGIGTPFVWVQLMPSMYVQHIQRGEKANKRRHQVCKVRQMLERSHWQPAFGVVLREVSCENGRCQPCTTRLIRLCISLSTSLSIFAHFLFNCQRLGDLMGSWAIPPFAHDHEVHDPLSALSYQHSPRAFPFRKDHLIRGAWPLRSASKELQQRSA